MPDPDPAQMRSGAEATATADAAHESSLTSEASPQSPVNEPDPFSELENLIPRTPA